jgi:TolB protein
MRRAAVFCLAALAGVGCAGFELGQLPPEPVAFIYRTGEEGRQRAELIDPEARPQQRTDAKIMRVGDARDYVFGATPQSELVRTVGRLALLDPQTLQVTPLGVARAGSSPLEWSPDHRKLRYLAIEQGRYRVNEYDVESGALALVAGARHSEPAASVGPDGSVAFARLTGKGREAKSRIFVRPVGGQPRLVTPGPSDTGPAWSPDGSHLLFITVNAGGALAVGSADPAGEAPPRLIARGRDPVFTPDGKWVIYSSRVKGEWRLHRMLPNGGGKKMLRGSVLGGPDELQPAVSPDGVYVAYVARRLGREKLRVRRLDGSGDRPLLEGGDGSSPVW